MDTFTNLIRRYSPQEVMTELYKLSLKMMENDNKGFLNIPVHLLIKNRGLIKEQITLPVWKISEIVYWSIVKSNDYRNKKLRDSDIIRIINEFYDFDNERTDVSFLKDVRFDEISQFLCGTMGEQEQFQNLQWVINSFNRNYHILIGSKKIQRNLKKKLCTGYTRRSRSGYSCVLYNINYADRSVWKNASTPRIQRYRTFRNQK